MKTTTEQPGAKLSGSLGVPSLVFLVLSAAAPMAAITAVVAIIIGYGVGVGAPGIFIACGFVLFCFATGYAAMGREISNTGAFYAYVSRGLGPIPALGVAFVSLVSYLAIFIATCGSFGFFANIIFKDQLGIDLPWLVWTAAAMLVTALLGYRKIDVSARVLAVVFTLEIAIIMALNIAILASEGFGAFTLQVFNPANVFDGAPGVALAFAFALFLGFESTVIFGEEARDPRRTVPRATYAAVGLITLFFVLSTWSLIAGAGADTVQATAAKDPGNFVFNLMRQYVGEVGFDVMQLLFVVSYLGCLLGLHNISTRYFYALGRDGILPRRLGRTHAKYRSPHVASVTQICVSAVCVLAFALAGADPYLTMTTALSGLATIGIIAMQSVVSFAVIKFFWSRDDRRTWNTVIAPLLGAIGMIGAVVLIVQNYELLAHTNSTVLNHLPWLLVIMAVAGCAYGLWMRSTRPDEFERIASVLGVDRTVGPLDEQDVLADERVTHLE